MTQATSLLEKSNRILIIAHPRPDGDTIGCSLALRLALMQRDKEPVVACIHPLPPNLLFLPGAEVFVTDVTPEERFDLVVAVDMSDIQRTGGIYRDAWRPHVPLLVIDHHETNNAFGDVNLVAEDVAATALPLYELLLSMGGEITPEIADCLLTAVLTDTRGLRTESTTPEVLNLVSLLIEADAHYMTVVEEALDSVPYQQMQGWGVAIDRMRLEDGIAWTTFPLETKLALGIEDHDDLNLGNFVSRVAEAKMIATFLEMRDGTVKISFRARPGYNVSWIAELLGGGGHRLAAGCSVTGELDRVVERVLPYLREERARHLS